MQMANNSKELIDIDNLSAEEVVIEVMRFFGYRRNYQVAEYFKVTPQTLSGWIRSGEIPAKHLIRFNAEIVKNNKNTIELSSNKYKNMNEKIDKNQDYSITNAISIVNRNLKFLISIPLFFITLSSIYVFLIADSVYTSKSKVLPISEDGSASSSFSGFASQLGINMPLSIGGKVPWDEIYPEILKSSDLLSSMLEEKYKTNRYGSISLEDILIKEHNLDEYNDLDQKNRVIDRLRQMIKIGKDRTSPIVNIDVLAFEPLFASKLAKDLIAFILI